MALAKALARDEGIFVGISGGATLAGALAVAREAKDGATILCMLPDTGERYLSTPLFEGISADMNDEEQDIARSTPGARFDAPPPAAVAEAPAPKAPAAALAFFDETITDGDNPVVLFALEWCEFCWSVRKLFADYGVPHRSIDLDSVPYQKNNWGGDIRAAIRERTGLKTIPQIFVGGQHIGGATEVFDAFKDGRMQALLADNRVTWKEDSKRDPYSYLPAWLHARR
jgi:cysteine synthase A